MLLCSISFHAHPSVYLGLRLFRRPAGRKFPRCPLVDDKQMNLVNPTPYGTSAVGCLLSLGGEDRTSPVEFSVRQGGNLSQLQQLCVSGLVRTLQLSHNDFTGPIPVPRWLEP